MSQELKQTHETIHLKDYQPPAYFVDRVHLDFDLFTDHTIVSAKMQVRRNPDVADSSTPLVLSGHHMELQSTHINGETFQGQVTDHNLTLNNVPSEFTLETVVRIEPQNNKALEGLYKSGDMYCTQCEAEGFRRITYFVDRPDNMSLYSSTIRADKSKYPVLLSNGNKIESRDLDDGRHQVTWEDPFKKPSYLFAMVAGDLDHVENNFTTHSGRKVVLQVFVDKGQSDRATFALEALEKSMRWDEFRYGLEYDLDIYMIVAVDAFNMGAMENKGLNIFNSKYVLANHETATDSDYISIESIIGHEYFHNWTGNRVTCRDWFQLSLKEGLTVYRDQEFTSDHYSRTVNRIENVTGLRSRQFQEDAGPNAHPVRPQSCVTVDNFYTATVYSKGAEVIRMIEQLIGRDNFRKGIDKYFELFDGQAVTTEDFIHAMAEASGFDFEQFKLWYDQAGTPQLAIQGNYDQSKQTYTLKISQTVPDTIGQTNKKPMLIPVKLGLLDDNGQAIELNIENAVRMDDKFNAILPVTDKDQEFTFTDVASKPVPSLLRDLSAPVKLDYNYSEQDLIHLMTNDTNEFNRWEAAQQLYICEFQRAVKVGDTYTLPETIKTAFSHNLKKAHETPLFTSHMLRLPPLLYLKQFQEVIDSAAMIDAYSHLEQQIGSELETQLLKTYAQHHSTKPYHFGETDAANRFLKNICLYYLTATGKEEHLELAANQFNEADNMTDQMASLNALNHRDHKLRDEVMQSFYNRWHKNKVVFPNYIRMESLTRLPTARERVQKLFDDPNFDKTTPNHIYASLRSFAFLNLGNFHNVDGLSYSFIADKIIEIDSYNHQVAASIAEAFEDWKQYSSGHQEMIRAQLERIKAVENLSNNTFEIVNRALS